MVRTQIPMGPTNTSASLREKVFETKDKTIGWDGTFRNKMCEPGVYVYYLQATCISGIKNIIKGNVTLIR